MKKTVQFWSLFALIFFFGEELNAQDVYNLWAGQEKPYYKENQLKEYQKELWGTQCVFNITEPTLTVYPAKGSNLGKAVIIIPGGGYELVALYHEGYDIAEILSEQGITAGVLKYRLPNPKTSEQPHQVPLQDTRRALSLLREKADQYGIEPSKVGLMGFSAGSHLATVASLWKSDVKSENPNYSVLVYGVTVLDKENMKWLEESLYFRKLTEAEISQNTLIDLVSKDTPPAFLVHAYDDDVCNVEETTQYAQKLVEHQVLVETHLFSKGGHGFGIGRSEDGTNQWISLFVEWVKHNDL